ncbi:MAG: hypothetical protein ABL961_03560 [Vicinamibacterales bacterium]
MTDAMVNPPDDEFVRRLQEEQSEARDLSGQIDPHSADLEMKDEPDTTPENT